MLDFIVLQKKQSLKKLYDKHGNSEYKTSLRDLIQADPKVFYTGILRHCSIKPIPFKKFDLHEKNSDTQVLYPKDNPVLYRAPLGYFVSLKINKVKPSSGTAIYPIFPCCIKSEERRKNNIYQIYKECSSDHEFKRKIELMLVRVLSTTIVNIDYVSSIYTPLNSVWSASEYLRIRVVDWFEEFSCERFNENLNDEDKQILYRNTKDLGFIDVPLYWNMYKNLDMI
ncbi:hypothetical protein K502DRAFT_327914 [Neoconidiobolus thromboides FSU 785]|nr:hypothetical protein K502DRAFT_327914 [Neoconidiobolus thromboides FSU 785]